MYFADEFAKRYLTGWVPVRAIRYCVVSAAHMSYRAPDSDPCEPEDSNANPMTSYVVVGCSRLGPPLCSRKSARGWRQ
eukprot:7710609-Pyramimonas_sp.AAC.1